MKLPYCTAELPRTENRCIQIIADLAENQNQTKRERKLYLYFFKASTMNF